MAYTEDAVLSKLSALNESHDSIATAAQWIMFHKRYANRTVQLWLFKLRDLPSPKRLNMIYLSNEVVQQSKARHRDDFLLAFSPVIAEGIALAYKGASSEIQAKLRRVVDVWKDRSIFTAEVQGDVEARLNEFDRSRGSARPSAFGSLSASSSSASVPPELAPLLAPLQRLGKTAPSKINIKHAEEEYNKLMGPDAPASSALPVFAARLNGLFNVVASAAVAVSEGIQARKELVGALEKMVAANREEMDTEEALLEQTNSRKAAVGARIDQVEDAIMQSLAPGDGVPGSGGSAEKPESERPQVEALTPPHVQDSNEFYEPSDNGHQPPEQMQGDFCSSVSGIEMLSTLASQYSAVPVNGTNKRRKIDSEEEMPDLGGDDGIDAETARMLRESR